MHVRITEGFELSYCVEGEGQPLLFLPGILGDATTFVPVVELLKDRYRCITVEFAGQGETVIDGLTKAGDFSIDAQADAVSALLDELALESPYLVGLSFGSVVSVCLAHRQPERFPKIALLGSLLRNQTYHYQNSNRMWGMASHDDEWFARITAGLVYSETFWRKFPDMLDNIKERLGALNEQKRQAFRWNLEGIAAFPVEPQFQALRQPMLCVHGVEDVVHPIRELREVVAGNPAAQLVELPGVGHGLHHEAPGEIAEQLLRFFG